MKSSSHGSNVIGEIETEEKESNRVNFVGEERERLQVLRLITKLTFVVGGLFILFPPR